MDRFCRLASLIFVLMLGTIRVFGENYLNPQGPPGSEITRMPALDEVEPRQIIRSLPYPITESGSYTLVKNLSGVSGSNGIEVAASDVTIDLNGFALVGTSGSLAGIYVSGDMKRLYVLNGRIRNWGREGIDATSADSSRFQQLIVSTNGHQASRNGMKIGDKCVVSDCIFLENKFSGLYGGNDCKAVRCNSKKNTTFGMFLGENASLQDCTAAENGASGFRVLENGIITRCNAFGNGTDGFYVQDNTAISLCTASTNSQYGFNLSRGVTVSDCTAAKNSTGFQLYSAHVHDCTARENQDDGFFCFTGYASVIRNCTSQKNGGDGIEANTGTSVTGCFVTDHDGGSSQAGIRAGAQCVIADNTVRNNYNGIYEAGKAVIKGNTVCGNTYGIKSGASYGSLIIRNIAADNTSADIETTADRYGPIVNATGEIATNNPLVNIVF